MTKTLEFVRRAARVRALLLVALATVFGACDATDQLTSASDDAVDTPEVTGTGVEEVSLATSFRGGIPMGHFAMPTSQFGSVYNGAMRNIWPAELISQLSAIRARGGKVVLMFAGNERHYKDGRRHFSLTRWKERVNRFRGTNFSQFIKDGTIIGHYLIDEPNDPQNWGGRPVPGSTVEEMARYSKQLWPSMPTIVRAEPGYLRKTGRGYRYLDAAWAQYVVRKGTPSDYIRRNVADAQKAGLALVVGLNVTKGGPNHRRMSASLIKSAGTALLSSSYPCAFISWLYEGSYLDNRDVRSAMSALRSRAQSRATKSCRS
jgi:hypothetical protein